MGRTEPEEPEPPLDPEARVVNRAAASEPRAASAGAAKDGRPAAVRAADRAVKGTVSVPGERRP
jgi:hypothetical protein